MSAILRRYVIASLLWSLLGVGLLLPDAAADKPTPDLAVGRAAYGQYCARCHGLTGQGDGRDAKRLYPRPRDFTSGVFKFRSTASGTPPTDEDLFQTITNGLTAGGMPDWGHLDETVRWQLVHYLKTLSSTSAATSPEPLAMGSDPGRAHVDLAQGRQVYEKLGCASCHGAQGRGNGTSAVALTDNWGRRIPPADLTQGWNYRGGSEPRAITARILSGIDGSPMPSYAEAASADDVWRLAYYVNSLQQEPRWAVIVRVPRVPGSAPETPDDPRWSASPGFDVRLRNVVNAAGEVTAPQTVTAVAFRVVQTEQAISVRLSWHDPREDRSDSADAAALALRPSSVVGDVVTLQVWPLRDSPPLDLCLWSAKDDRAREAVARSYESVFQAAGPTRKLASRATYTDGEWTLVLTRPLAPEALADAAQLAPHRVVPVAFSIWDGSNAGQQAVSMWVDLMLPDVAPAASTAKPTGSVALVWIVSGVVLVIALIVALKRS